MASEPPRARGLASQGSSWRPGPQLPPKPCSAARAFHKGTRVISLAAALGRRRRSHIGLRPAKYSAWPGALPREVPRALRGRWARGRWAKERSEKLCATFVAHLRLWQAIAESDCAGAVVLEDDAKLLRPLPNISLPTDGITLLGGVLRYPGAMGKFLA